MVKHPDNFSPVINGIRDDSGRTSQSIEKPVIRSIRRHLLIGAAVAVFLIGCIGGWSTIASISSAIIATGHVAVESNNKLVQHAEGGIVERIMVSDGERVKAGDVLLKLDGIPIKSNLAIIVKRMEELAASKHRLMAERNGDPAIDYPKQFVRQTSEWKATDLIDNEKRLFRARRETLSSQTKQLDERISQIHEEISGLKSQRTAKIGELELAKKEHSILKGLRSKKLVPITKYISAQRSVVSLIGEAGQLGAEIARASGRVSETRLQIIQLEKKFREDVLQELRAAKTEFAELSERRVAAEDQLRRLEVTAPDSGLVHQLKVHTIGAVVSPGQELMRIVPQNEELIVDARVTPADIDQIYVGQDAKMNFSAFNQRTTPQLDGTLYSIAADLSEDERTGLQYYVVRFRPKAREMKKLKNLTLTPGMPVDVFVQTGSRSALSYLIKPFSDQLNRAFREE